MKSALTIPDYVRDALANVANKLGFTSEQYTVDYDFRAGEHNRSIVSVFYRVTFREEPREVTVLCKVPPPEADDVMLALFEREVFVYGKLLPAFEQFQRNRLQESVNVEEELVYFGPVCYHAHCDAKKREAIIVLEDVRPRGFSNRHKFEPLDYDHARLAMVQLGRFHATSLALKKQQPELFEQYRYMGDVTGERVLAMGGFEQAMEQAFENASATLNANDESKREKLARLRGSFVEELQNIGDTALSEPFCVVCHGDYAGENMMFSYNAQSIDEEASRVIVKFAIGNAQESLNEYMLQLVSKEEYQKYSKVLNAAKYEEYKNRETAIKSTEEEKDRDRSGQSSRDGTRPRKNRSPSPNERRSRDRDRYDRSRDKRDTQEKSKDRSKQRDDRHREHSDRRRSPNGKKAPSRRHDSSSSDNGVSDHNRATSSEDERERRQRKHKKSTSPYIRTSSGTKKKSHKYKQRRERRDDRDSSRDRRDRRRQGSDSESDDKHHKKKTKKSKKPRSRSRSRR